MKNATFTLEEIKNLESMTKDEIIVSFNQYSTYTSNNISLLTNVSVIDKSIYVGILLNSKSMKAKDIVKETGLTKSHISRLGKVGKWILANREQYRNLINTAGTALSMRLMCDSITHDTIKGVDDWASLVEAEKAYKESAKETTTPATPATKPTSDKAKAIHKPVQTPKHAFLIRDFERMNSTSMYSAIIRLCDNYKASGEKVDYMEAFISRLNELKH